MHAVRHSENYSLPENRGPLWPCWQTSKEITKGVDKTQETPRTFCPLRYLAFCVGAFCPVCWRCCADPGP